jgi:hypothetical protein
LSHIDVYLPRGNYNVSQTLVPRPDVFKEASFSAPGQERPEFGPDAGKKAIIWALYGLKDT